MYADVIFVQLGSASVAGKLGKQKFVQKLVTLKPNHSGLISDYVKNCSLLAINANSYQSDPETVCRYVHG